MGQASGSAWQHRLTDNWNKRNALTALLWPLSLVFGILVRLRRFLFRRGWLSTCHFPVPVIVVGNVVAGGVGKTPVVISIVRHLMDQNWQVGIVSRGYGRRTKFCMEVLHNSTADDVGDEPALIKRAFPHPQSVPVFVAAKREEAVRTLLRLHPETQVIVCDDGLQHFALHRDVEICIFDDRGIGNGLLLPAGPLREPWPRPVDLILNTGTRPLMEGFGCRRELVERAQNATGEEISLSNLSRESKPLLALAGIARPDIFFDMLRVKGLKLEKTLMLPDHFNFDSWITPSDKDYQLICTYKDAVKLWLKEPDALAVGLDCVLDPSFLNALDHRLARSDSASLSSGHGHTTT